MQKSVPPELIEPVINFAVALFGYLIRVIQVALTKKTKPNDKIK